MVIYNKGLSTESSTAEGKEIFSLTSKEEEKYKVRRVIITDVVNNNVLLDIWLEREKIADNIPLFTINDATPERVVDVDVEIPVGYTFSIKIKDRASGSHGYVVGWVEYEIVA